MPLDTEPKNVTTFNITCRVSHDKNVRSISATLTVNLQDQNDNPPTFADGSQIMSVLMTDEKQVSVFTVTIKQIMFVLMTDEKQVSVFTVTIKLSLALFTQH